MNTQKRTRRKFTDQQKQNIVNEADAIKAAGGEYKTVLQKHALTSSVLSKWRLELSAQEKPHRNASKASRRKIAPRLTLDSIVKELSNLEKELNALEQRREKIMSMKIADLL